MRKKVAIQGEPGSYSEMAAVKYFSDPLILNNHTFLEAFDAAESGNADFAVLPVENSIEGSVNEVYDILLQTKELSAIGEVYQRIHHCLISNKGVEMAQIRFAYSHPQALAQCREYLRSRNIEPIASYDTAGSAKVVKQEQRTDAAAIASKRAAEYYKMKVLQEGIEDRKNNFTRFLVLSRVKPRTASSKSGKYKTSIIFSVQHEPGALYGILSEFANLGINLTKIESRPTKEKPWEYNFYLDFEGKMGDKRVSDALNKVTRKTSALKIIGSYPRARAI